MQQGNKTMKTSLIRATGMSGPRVRKALEAAGFLVFEATDGGRDLGAAPSILGGAHPPRRPDDPAGGLEVLRSLHGAGDDTPELIVITHGRIPATIQAVRLGAVNVLARP